MSRTPNPDPDQQADGCPLPDHGNPDAASPCCRPPTARPRGDQAQSERPQRKTAR